MQRGGAGHRLAMNKKAVWEVDMAFKNEGQGPYLILHYEMKEARGRSEKGLQEFILAQQGKPRTKYAFTFHGRGGRADAVKLWNALSAASRQPKIKSDGTSNPAAVDVRTGDTFYLHYAVSAPGEIGWFREETASDWLDPV
jgi:hypothetical protein